MKLSKLLSNKSLLVTIPCRRRKKKPRAPFERDFINIPVRSKLFEPRLILVVMFLVNCLELELLSSSQ